MKNSFFLKGRRPACCKVIGGGRSGCSACAWCLLVCLTNKSLTNDKGKRSSFEPLSYPILFASRRKRVAHVLCACRSISNFSLVGFLLGGGDRSRPDALLSVQQWLFK